MFIYKPVMSMVTRNADYNIDRTFLKSGIILANIKGDNIEETEKKSTNE